MRYESTHADGNKDETTRKPAASAESVPQLCTEQHASKREARGDRADDPTGLQDVHANHCKTKTNHQRINARCERQAEHSAQRRQAGVSSLVRLL